LCLYWISVDLSRILGTAFDRFATYP